MDKILLDELILNGTVKTKLAMLAFLNCGEFVKKSTELVWKVYLRLRCSNFQLASLPYI